MMNVGDSMFADVDAVASRRPLTHPPWRETAALIPRLFVRQQKKNVEQ